MKGTKTTTTGLASDYERHGGRWPRPGGQEAVGVSAGGPVALPDQTGAQVAAR